MLQATTLQLKHNAGENTSYVLLSGLCVWITSVVLSIHTNVYALHNAEPSQAPQSFAQSCQKELATFKNELKQQIDTFYQRGDDFLKRISLERQQYKIKKMHEQLEADWNKQYAALAAQLAQIDKEQAKNDVEYDLACKQHRQKTLELENRENQRAHIILAKNLQLADDTKITKILSSLSGLSMPDMQRAVASLTHDLDDKIRNTAKLLAEELEQGKCSSTTKKIAEKRQKYHFQASANLQQKLQLELKFFHDQMLLMVKKRHPHHKKERNALLKQEYKQKNALLKQELEQKKVIIEKEHQERLQLADDKHKQRMAQLNTQLLIRFIPCAISLAMLAYGWWYCYQQDQQLDYDEISELDDCMTEKGII